MPGNVKRGCGDDAGRGVSLGPTTRFGSSAARRCSLCWSRRRDDGDVRLRFSGPPGWDYESIGSNTEYQNEIRSSYRPDPGGTSWQPGYCGDGAEFGKFAF